jgi:hypothetical protein
MIVKDLVPTPCGTKVFVIMGKRDSDATLAALTLAAEAG